MKNNKTAYKCGYMQALTDLQAQIDIFNEWAKTVDGLQYSEMVHKKIQILREVMNKCLQS